MIRLPEIPGLQGTAINSPAMRPAAAAAPAEALGGVAGAIAGVSDQFHHIAIQTQRLENARVASEARQQLATDYAQHQLDLQSDPDPASRMRKTASFLTAYKGRMDNPDLPPAVRDDLVQHFDGFATEATIRQAQDSASLATKRAHLAFQNEIQTAIDNGDAPGAHAALSRLSATGTMLPEEKTAAEQTINQKIGVNKALGMIQADPFVAQEELAKPDFLKNHPGIRPDDLPTLQSHARAAVREATLSDISSIHDAIASGTVATPEDIDRYAGHLSPWVREEMKTTLARRNSALGQQWLADPEVQARITGEANTAISNYSPTDPDKYDQEFARIHGIIDQLPAGAAHDELKRRLGDVRTQTDSARKTAEKRALDSLETAYKSGGFGVIPKETPGEVSFDTSAKVADGFLRDDAKLATLGFSKDQLAARDAAVADALKVKSALPAWKIKGDPSKRQESIVIENNTAREWLRENWAHRADPVTANPEDMAIAEAIHAGTDKSKFIDPAQAVKDAAAIQAAQQAKGKAITQFLDWRKDNPDAPEKAMQEKLFEYAGESARKAWISGAAAPPALPGATSAIPPQGIKLSNYGYKTDTTPDSNSAKGIGHSNNKLTDEKSAAITKSLAEKLGLAPGDEFLIDSTAGSRVLRYDDTVPTTDPRTGSLPETIDIYRPSAGHNKWGGVVTGFRKL